MPPPVSVPRARTRPTASGPCGRRFSAPTLEQRAGIALMSVHGIQTSLQVADIVCEAAGSTALYAASPFDRRRRDLMTIAGHLVGQRRAYQTAGQLLFGDDVPTFV